MNALDCLNGASPEVRSIAASCVKAVQPLLEYRQATVALEAIARAAAIIATSCAADGAEGAVMTQLAAFIRSIAEDAAGSNCPHRGAIQ